MNNCIAHTIAQILDGPQAQQQSRTLRGRCVDFRTPLVHKYGRSPRAELEVTVWWRLIIEELGGRPHDWNVLCWTGYMYDTVERAGNGALCARLRHSAGPPGHFETLWVSIVDLPAAPLQPINEHPTNTIEDGGSSYLRDDCWAIRR